jgi:hypothetical protein
MSQTNRRELLIHRMNELEARGMSCLGCSGACCTFQANSMMVTPLEAFDLVTYLKEKNLLSEDLKTKLKASVQTYRLDHKPLSGRSYLRKTYTCPFFGHAELGCPLPREVKPYGCLAFDSHHETLKADENCYSEKELLEERERRHPEESELNRELVKKFNLLWEKSPIPTALLDLWEKV